MTELNVAAKLRIMPENVNTDLEGIKNQVTPIVEKVGKVHETEIKPIAFGLNSLEVTILLDDTKGGTEEIEKKISEIENVKGVEVISVTRI